MSTWDILGLCGIVCAALTAIAVGYARRLRTLRLQLHHSDRDRLTGLPSRNALDRHLHQLRQSRTPYVLGLLNLDSFDAFNKEFGYRQGDQVLVLAAGRIKAKVSSTGGSAYGLQADEFAIVWPHCDRDTGCQRAGELLAEFQQPLEIIGPRHSHLAALSAGMGIADASHGSCPDGSLMMRRADTALQVARLHGPGIMLPWTARMADHRRRRNGQKVYGLIRWSPEREPTLLIGRHLHNLHREAVRVFTERLGTDAESWARVLHRTPQTLQALMPVPDHADWDNDPQPWLEQLAETLPWPAFEAAIDIEEAA